MEYDQRYLTVDKLSSNSLALINVRLKEFLHTYNVKHYPINCFELLDQIIASKTIILEKMEDERLSFGFDAAVFGNELGYCIFVNSRKKWNFNYSSNRRCNFTIAHELGHLFLGHLETPRRFKNREIEAYENLEADEFAGRLLMPEKLLLASNFRSREAVAAEFLVSHQALYKRVNNLKRLDLFSSIPVLTCKCCGNYDISPLAEYCIICGTELIGENANGIRQTVFGAIPMDGFQRITVCPRCQNEEMSKEARYCRICGVPLYNECNCDKWLYICHHMNQSNARYCEVCGQHTLFFDSGLLADWQTERDNYVHSILHG